MTLYHACQFYPTTQGAPFDPTPFLVHPHPPKASSLGEVAGARRTIRRFAYMPSSSLSSTDSTGEAGGGAAARARRGFSGLGTRLDTYANERQSTTQFRPDSALTLEASWSSAWSTGNEPPLKKRARKVAEALFGTSAGTNAGWHTLQELGQKVLRDKAEDERAQKGFEEAFFSDQQQSTSS